jgi:hypothetical protein
MSFIKVTNDSGAGIEVAVASVTNKNGTGEFSKIGAGETMRWPRAGNEVVFVNRLRGDNTLEPYVGILDRTLIIQALSSANKEMVFVATDVANRQSSCGAMQHDGGGASAWLQNAGLASLSFLSQFLSVFSSKV